MKKKTIRNIILPVLGILLFHACTSDFIVSDLAPVPPGKVFTLSGDVQPIFTSKCIGCHTAGVTNPDLTVGHSYNNLMTMNLVDTLNPAQSVIYVKITTGDMAGFCTPSDAQTILEWIKQGAKNN